MKRRTFRVRPWIASVLLLSLFALPASATVLPDIRFESLLRSATHIVIAEVGEQTIVAAPRGALLPRELHTELVIERSLRGRAPQRLTIRQLGTGGCGSGERILDDACLRPGARVLLFLRAGRALGERDVVHLTTLGFSAFDIRSEAGVEQAVPHARLEGEAPADEPSLGRVMRLDVVERLVREFDLRRQLGGEGALSGSEVGR